MIRHYDMTTCEAVEDGDQDRPAETLQHPAEAASLRLMTVQEAVALPGRKARLPADIATLPVEIILAKWV